MVRCRTLVFLPVGPGTNVEFVADTLDSVAHFAEPGHCVLIADDSGQGLGAKLTEGRESTAVVKVREDEANPTRQVSRTFTAKIAAAFRHAVEHYDFDQLLRLDEDALMIGKGAEDRAAEMLRANPRLGQIGSYRVRCDGVPRDFGSRAAFIKREIKFQIAPARRALRRLLLEMLPIAQSNGYELGEHVIAPGSFFARRAIEALAASPYFGHPDFRATTLGSDHVTGLTLRTLGFELGDFATGDLPLGVWLKNLEWSPEELVARGKCIVHSVRTYKEWDEARVRAEFRRLRDNPAIAQSSNLAI